MSGSGKQKRFVTRGPVRDHIVVREEANEANEAKEAEEAHVVRPPGPAAAAQATQPPHLSVEVATSLCGCAAGARGERGATGLPGLPVSGNRLNGGSEDYCFRAYI